MTEWLQQHQIVLWWLVALSVATFVVSLITVPLVIVRIPPDYFSKNRRQWKSSSLHHNPTVHILLLIGKNLLGCFFLVAGFFMVFLPGQGILCMLIGIGLLNFPGKFRLERWIVSRKHVLKSINWLRTRAGKEPLTIHKPASS